MQLSGNGQVRRKFFPIKTETLLDNAATHFDVYALFDKEERIAEQGDFLLYAKAPYTWTLRELTELTRVGVQYLFIHENQRPSYDRYKRLNQNLPEIDHSLAPKFRIQAIQDIGQHLIESCFLTEIDAKLCQRLEAVSGEVVSCLLEDPQTVLNIQSLCEYDLYTYVHSVGVATLTAAVALKLGETNPDRLRYYAMGGLMHDLGKKCVPIPILNKPGPLTPEEWEVLKSHPSEGLVLTSAQSLDPIVTDIIGLHHEKLDGSGYPHGFSKEKIPTHVLVATVADIFNALTTTRSYHRKRNRFEALMFMKHHLRGKIDSDVFKALVSCLIADGKAPKSQAPD